MAARIRTSRYVYFLAGGIITMVQQPGDKTPVALVPDPGDLLAAVLVFHNGVGGTLTTGGADQTFNLLVNGVAEGTVLSAAEGADFFQGRLLPLADPIALKIGDVIQLESNGEAIMNVIADVNWIVRR